jgi:hypothetical protein
MPISSQENLRERKLSSISIGLLKKENKKQRNIIIIRRISAT